MLLSDAALRVAMSCPEHLSVGWRFVLGCPSCPTGVMYLVWLCRVRHRVIASQVTARKPHLPAVGGRGLRTEGQDDSCALAWESELWDMH